MIHPYFIQMTIFQNFTVNILTDQWTKKYPKFPDKAKSEPWLTLKHVLPFTCSTEVMQPPRIRHLYMHLLCNKPTYA